LTAWKSLMCEPSAPSRPRRSRAAGRSWTMCAVSEKRSAMLDRLEQWARLNPDVSDLAR
jgi:hypothetical protein